MHEHDESKEGRGHMHSSAARLTSSLSVDPIAIARARPASLLCLPADRSRRRENMCCCCLTSDDPAGNNAWYTTTDDDLSRVRRVAARAALLYGSVTA